MAILVDVLDKAVVCARYRHVYLHRYSLTGRDNDEELFIDKIIRLSVRDKGSLILKAPPYGRLKQ